MKILNKYKYNYLLKGAVMLQSTFFLIYFIFFSIEEMSFSPNRLDGLTDFKTFIFKALLIAPIFEELVFRSYFTKSKLLKLISIIGLSIFLLLSSKSYLLFIAVPYLFFLIVDFVNFFKINKHLIYISSAVIFAMFHYKLDLYSNVISILPILSQFSVGLLLVWIVINFNLKMAIFTHFLYNLLFITPLLFILQFPNIEQKSIENKGYKISWKKTPIFNGNHILSKPNPYQITGFNITPIFIYKTYDSAKKINLKDKDLFVKYKIDIEKLNDSVKKLDSTLVKTLLLKANLIIEIKTN